MIFPAPLKNAAIKKYDVDGNTILFSSERGLLRIVVYKDDVFRISYTENGVFNEQQGFEFTPVSEFASVTFTVQEKDSEIEIRTNTKSIYVNKQSGELTFQPGSAPFCKFNLEAFDSYKTIGNMKVEEVKTADGVKKRVLAADREFDKTLYHTKTQFNFAADEKLYGLGQAEEGCWNLRGTTQYLHQANKKIAIPFLISSKGYGLLYTTQSPAIFTDTQYGTYFYTEADYYLDFFYIAPETKTDIIARMRELTGKALIPPKYAFGYVQSQERYETQEEILATVDEFKKRNIPLSLIVLDWLSWDDGMWGQKSFDKKRFPDVPAMIEKLHAQNVHFMISIWPSMDEKCDNYKEMKEQGTLLNGINIVNAFDKSARELYWQQAKKGLADYGVESWWCDSSEPITPEWNHVEQQLPENQYKDYILATSDVMPIEKANTFGLYHARGMYEGQLKDIPDRRMLILTRNGYSGSQKYGVTLWSGDTSATWQTYRNQITAAVQFSLSGVPYWTLDIGGFFVKNGLHWYWSGDYDQTTADENFRELYTRWFQFGAFLPMFRAHGTDCRREPWAFCDETNKYYDSMVMFIKLRYQLMPYIYSVAAHVWKDNGMFISPLFMNFADKAVESIDKQYMFGPSIMVCPVIEAGVTSCKVYLPADCDWYDWWSGEKFAGGQWITAAAEIDKMPLFVRDGSIIPVEDGTILRFPDKNGNCKPFELYEDDGESYDYLKGQYKIKEIK